jgi:uncharacterized protein YdhG (YjbR/CyaY superfamily)
MQTKFEDVDSYIASFPADVQTTLELVRNAIKSSAPKAEEIISYNMPAYKCFGMLVYFAGYKQHIGFYPTASAIAAFKDDLSKYKNAKGSVQFPLDKPLPITLIKKIVKFRVKENLEKAKANSLKIK